MTRECLPNRRLNETQEFERGGIAQWSPLQTRYAMTIANAKYYAFAEASYEIGDLVQLGLLTRPEAADLLQQVAEYNQLPLEYGQDRIQRLMADGIALREAA